MRVAIPSLLIDSVDNEYKISIAYIPPILTLENSSGIYRELLEKILSREGDVNFEFKDRIVYYSCILGGIMIYLGEIPITRFEYYGYFYLSNDGKNVSLKELIKSLKSSEEGCYKFKNNSICFTRYKCKGCRWIDNIGARIIYYGYSMNT
ncbi:MAG: hypothetical protein QXV69_04635 [Sulfolobaceae archaeon]